MKSASAIQLVSDLTTLKASWRAISKRNKLSNAYTRDTEEAKHHGVPQIPDSVRFVTRATSGSTIGDLNDCSQILTWDNPREPFYAAKSYSKVSERGLWQEACPCEIAEECSQAREFAANCGCSVGATLEFGDPFF